jgi:PadR family transcriptional regulator PadR
MDATIKRGSAELAILAVLEQQAGHGYEVARRISERSDGVLKFTLASLYPMLYQLEREGCLKGEWEQVAGRRRRCYRLTPAGRRRLVPLREDWRAFLQALESVAGVSGA